MGGEPPVRREKARKSRAAKEPPPGRRLALQVLRKLRGIFRTAKSNVQSRNDLRVTGAQFWALKEIQAHPGITVSEVARRMALHRSTVSNFMRKLFSTGLLRRQRDKEDDRVAHLYVTGAGRRVVNSVRYPRNAIFVEALQSLSLSELRKLDRNLDHLLQQMQLGVSNKINIRRKVGR